MKKSNERKSRITILLLMLFVQILIPLSLAAQNISITGTVIDESNEPIVGASVVVKNTTIGATTNLEGKYYLSAPSNAVLQFMFLGYTTQEINVNGRTVIDVVLHEDVTTLEEMVVVGYGTQKRGSLTGAISSIKGSTMLQTKNENPQNMLTGKIAGVRVWQKSAEPGSYNNNFDIRALGSPLIVIDGIPRTTEDFQRLNPSDIEDISVLKDASAAIYGVRSANGVVLVTTKKGEKDGKSRVNYNGSFTFQRPSGMPVLADPYETMTLYNERSMNNINGGTPIYTEDYFEAYRNGSLRSADWTSLIFSDWAPQTQHDFSVSGGTEKTQYYISLGYNYQEGFFKSGDLNYEKYNIRSNITTRIAKGLNLELSLSGIADETNNPYSTSVDIIRNYWRQGVLVPAYADPENTMLNYEGLDLEENTVAKMTSDISGYRKYQKKFFQSQVGLNYDFGTLSSSLKGLSVKGLFGYDYREDNNSSFRREYYQYAYNKVTQTYDQKLYGPSSPSRMLREFYSKQQYLTQFMINFDRTFAEVHNVKATVGWEASKKIGDNFYAQRDLAFSKDYLFLGVDEGQVGSMYSGDNDIYEIGYEAFIGRLNYNYDDRYLLEAQFRYDGVSIFVPDNRWGFFPSVSAGWRVSEEPFVKDISALSFINNLKLRASYGLVGSDGAYEYDWVTGYEYPATSGNASKGYYNQYAPGYIFDNAFIYAMNPVRLPNDESTWQTSRSLDLGIEFEGWNGLFGFAFDYFNRHRFGLFAQRGDLPTVIGAGAPRENLNSDRHLGLDLELTHRNSIGEFKYNTKAIGTITRQMYLTAVQNGPYGNSYDKWRNDNLNDRYQGVQFGYEANGRFESWEDIWYYNLYHERDVLPGDYKYVDWNGDGEINSLDEHPYAYDQTPWLNFSFLFDSSYKNFDFNFLLQGSALGSMQYQEPLYSIWGSNGGGTLVQYLDRWHPVDPTADPYNPRTEWVSGYYGYTGHYPIGNSEFNRVSTAYLRLKSVELGYTLPKIRSFGDMNLRVYANAYNLLTFTGVKFVDPEHPDDELGRLYPLNKTFTLGLTLSF
jgi:TonB-linked SusC/RagA family outer membrane protein